MLDLKGKNIIITGASSGIGRSCSVLASKLGANVHLMARDITRLEETYSKLDSGNHSISRIDVTKSNEIEDVVKACVEKSGPMDGFVHCAGIEMTLPLSLMNSEKYNLLFSTNTISALEFARVLSKKKNINPVGGSFVFISSVMGQLGSVGKVAYCSSKSALSSASKAIALELANKHIRVNCVLPGIVETEMFENMIKELPEESIKDIYSKHPLGIGKPEDVANLCMFLLSDLSKWITASEIVIDGGYSAA